uniref:Uncharacterized protein n=1 Tax=Mycena chlorophos TaxID=658473 RepID=A0ABQ0LXE3_MYCCL|nr:predicted protein [Mycena chlorophos]
MPQTTPSADCRPNDQSAEISTSLLLGGTTVTPVAAETEPSPPQTSGARLGSSRASSEVAGTSLDEEVKTGNG